MGVHERSGVIAKRGSAGFLHHIMCVVTTVMNNPDELMQAAHVIHRRDRMCIEAEGFHFEHLLYILQQKLRFKCG